MFSRFFIGLLLFLSLSVGASEKDYRLHIHVHYTQDSDSWSVKYELPIAVDHVAFQRHSNFDRSTLYKVDESKFKWDKAGDVLLLRSVDGSKFTSLTLNFSSYYKVIIKDYTHNVKYTDGSVLLYTNHLSLGANIIEDKLVSPVGASFSGTEFHFYSQNQNIVFLGQSYKGEASWNLEGDGTYVYFGNIQPIESDTMIAIVDPALPKWAWNNTKTYFPELFNYYTIKTGQALNFKPIVFFNYDHLADDYSHYSGGTLEGLVQLTISGQRWKSENEEQFNQLFHFLAHEAAHFWNGQMFSFEDDNHSWMHEGGADTFANLAMMEFGLIDYGQMIQKFEDAANNCFLNKHNESLAQSAGLGRYRNYYTCGATMGLASHIAVKTTDPNKSVFDVWKTIFDTNTEDRTYSHQDYFNALHYLTNSEKLPMAFEKFTSKTNLDNQVEIRSWFQGSDLFVEPSTDYPKSVGRHWGQQIIKVLMKSHCKSISFNRYDDYIKTHPVDGCKPFEDYIEIRFVDGLDIIQDGINAYELFETKCETGETVMLQDRKNSDVAKMKCLNKVQNIKPYLKLLSTPLDKSVKIIN